MNGKFSFSSKSASYTVIIVLFIIIFGVVYAPVIQKAYLYYDDWGHFTPQGRSIGFFIDLGIIQGRIVTYYFLYVLSSLFDSSESTKLIRLIGIIGLALFAFVTYIVFKRCRFKSEHAFLMSTLICILPSSQINVAWTVCVPYLFGAAMSSLSALLCFSSSTKETTDGRLYKVTVLLSSIILLICALNIYQTAAMMYWTIGVIFVLSWDNYNVSRKDFRQFLITYFSVGLISTLLYYFVFMKVVPAYYYPHLSMKGGIIPLSDVIPAFTRFITSSSTSAMNLWNVNPTQNAAIFVSTFIFLGIIFNVLRGIRENKNTFVSNYIMKYIIVSSLVVATYLPHILTGSENAYRYMIALAPAISILFCFALINIVELSGFIPKLSSKSRNTIITMILMILTVVAAISAHNNLHNFAMLHSKEFQYVKNAVNEYGVAKLLRTSKIYFRRAGYRPWQLHPFRNEFTRNIVTHSPGGYLYPAIYSTRGIEQGEIGGSMARYVIRLALHEIGVKQDIHITEGEPHDPLPEDDNILVIDMMKFQIGLQIMHLVDFGDQESLVFQGPGWSVENPAVNASWTLSQKAVLIGKLPQKDSIRLIARISNPQTDQKVEIRLNGNTIAIWKIDKPGGYNEYSVLMKLSEKERKSISKIEVITDKLNVLSDKDLRQLGILVDWIRFE